MSIYRDREEAGRLFADKLEQYSGVGAIFALPRGGVPIGAKIANRMGCPLDVLVVRKIGAPNQPELAIGAIASGGVTLFNDEILREFSGQQDRIAAIIAREQAELRRRELKYRGQNKMYDVRGKTIVLTDDGAATGATMRAAIQAMRALNVARVLVALPVCAGPAARMLTSEADELICLQIPDNFFAVGQWYRSFEQVTDAEVCALLANASR